MKNIRNMPCQRKILEYSYISLTYFTTDKVESTPANYRKKNLGVTFIAKCSGHKKTIIEKIKLFTILYLFRQIEFYR